MTSKVMWMALGVLVYQYLLQKKLINELKLENENLAVTAARVAVNPFQVFIPKQEG